MTDTSWIPLPALARELGVHRRTLARWAAAPESQWISFPKSKIFNRRLYFQRDEIEAWKAATEATSAYKPMLATQS